MEAPLAWDCPFCGAEADFFDYILDDVAVYECSRCGELFTVPFEDWAPLAD